MALDISIVAGARPDNQIHYFPITTSTMTEAARIAGSGAPHGAVVLADEQTSGVGRLGRHWISEPEVGIYCSVVLRLPVTPSIVPVVTLALGLATAGAIEASAGIACDLRWPNDVLINERKTAGILAQLHDSAIVAGIGINVNQSSLPPDLRTPATSLYMATGRPLLREPIIIALLEKLDDVCELLVRDGPDSIIRAFTAASSYVLHRRVIYESDQTPRRGTTIGLDSNGFLRVRDDSGAVHALYTGGVRPDSSQ